MEVKNLSNLKSPLSRKKIVVMGQNVLIRRDKTISEESLTKFGIYVPTAGATQEEGLVFGIVISCPADQNLLIDKTRPISERQLKVGDRVWYSGYSACKIFDSEHPGEYLDIIPLEDIRAVIEDEYLGRE
jgi:co-chaperonin GroES (HSP10)